MPLNRPAEPLAPGPRGATQARRWVSGVCEEIGRSDLVENAALALSEVVTNAILHGRPPVTVRLRGTRDHPRVEVRDASPDPPAPAHTEMDQEFQLEIATFGRGLAIVASSSLAWGAERDGDGKLVWFEPAVDSPDEPPEGVFQGFDGDPDEPTFEGVHSIVVHLLHVPTEAMQVALAHGAELRRELRLLAVAHQDTYPVASDLSTFFSALARDFRWQMGGEALREALVAGRHAPRPRRQGVRRLRRPLRPADRALRARRRLLPQRAAADPGPLPRAGGVPDLDVRGVRPAVGRSGPDAVARRRHGHPVEGSAVAQLVQPVVVDPEVVGDLVDHRDPHLAHQLVGVATHLEQGSAEDRDPVRQPGVVGPALGQGHPVVDAEQVRVVVRRVVLDQDDDVVDEPGDLVGDLVQGLVHQGVEVGPVEVHAAEPSREPQRPAPDGSGAVVSDVMATPTGLEPAASAVTGRRANQLRYGASRSHVRERMEL